MVQRQPARIDYLPACLAALAQVFVLAGNLPQAEAALAGAEGALTPAGAVYQPVVTLSRAWLAAGHGETSRARWLAGEAADRAEASGQNAVAVLAVHDLARLGDPDASRLEQLAARVDGPFAPACALHAAALATGDGQRLDRAADAFAAMEAKLLAAEAAAQAAAVHCSRFTFLLAQNPNYFGNLEKSELGAVKKIASNTTFEQLTCVGYNVEKGLLEATIAIKQAAGYGGSLCFGGSIEYVRFFVDTGLGWQDVGVAGVKVHDIPTHKDCTGALDKPLTYIATLAYNPKGECCDEPVLPNVRAILSWQWEPPAGNPNWVPVWGSRHECHVQIKPKPWSLLCLFDNIKVRVPELFDKVKDLPIPQPDPPPFKLAELAKMYSPERGPMAVEPHRFGVADVHMALSEGGFDEQLFASKKAEWAAAGLDWGKALAELNKTKANVSYEELECLGLDERFPERLVATLRIKRPYGYNGDLCHKGGNEYVAFWADWDNSCDWTYLGTQAVNVHDIATIPKDGLCYSAIQVVDLDKYRNKCQTPTIGRVRAVLSWNVPPSTRVRVRKHTDHAVVIPLTGDFYVEKTGSGYDHQMVASGEWFQYLPGSYMNRLLAYWNSSGDEQWEVQLDIASAPNSASILSSSPWYLIQLDNTAPQGPPALPPTMDIHLKSAGNQPLADCKDVKQGMTITGNFVADDPHFGAWRLTTEPNTAAFPSNNPEVTGLATTTPAPGPAGHDWTLHTAPPPAGLNTMKPCGYVVRLDVWDRTIVNSMPGQHNWNNTSVGFCLRGQ